MNPARREPSASCRLIEPFVCLAGACCRACFFHIHPSLDRFARLAPHSQRWRRRQQQKRHEWPQWIFNCAKTRARPPARRCRDWSGRGRVRSHANRNGSRSVGACGLLRCNYIQFRPPLDSPARPSVCSRVRQEIWLLISGLLSVGESIRLLIRRPEAKISRWSVRLPGKFANILAERSRLQFGRLSERAKRTNHCLETTDKASTCWLGQIHHRTRQRRR